MSVSTSGENLASDAQSCDGGSMCLELALEGERLCKAGDCRAGVAFFQAAIQAGTDDLRTLSAIYSQLGNAYFYLGDYNKAMQYHKHDLTLARTMGDKLGEAKASGNLGNTLKVMGKFTEAIQCCKRQLDLSRELKDSLSEGRALYNLGNVHHAQGKHLGRVGQNDPGHFPQEVRECLLQAVTYYEENLELMRSLGDRAAMGRACGNLGNTCYLLGEFGRAIRYHTERLQIAQEFGDRSAERRANSNLANSHIFLGQFENAAEHYKRTLQLAEESGEAAVAAQACYSLGNTYTLLREHRAAEEYHSRHLAAARALRDRVGEGRAAWSLGNAHAALGNHREALRRAADHYAISEELGDVLGMATAQMNISDLRKVLGLPAEAPLPTPAPRLHQPISKLHHLRVRRQSMEQLALIQITPDGKKKDSDDLPERPGLSRSESEESPVENFLELVSRCQSSRMEEQRAPLGDKENRAKRPEPSRNDENFLDLVSTLQSERMDSQRAELRPLATKEPMAPKKAADDGGAKAVDVGAKAVDVGAKAVDVGAKAVDVGAKAVDVGAKAVDVGGKKGKEREKPNTFVVSKEDEELLKIITRLQGSRIDEQRTALPRSRPQERPPASTVPDDDFFSLLMRAQASRLEDQRAAMPLNTTNQNKSTSSSLFKK